MTLAHQIQALIPADVNVFNIVCIGTDRSTGDSLGPWVGSLLQQRGVSNVFGTLDEPVHAMNLKETIDQLPDRFTIAIDACLGQSSSVGLVKCGKGPLEPGAGVGKDLPPVGDMKIYGVVNVGGFMEYFVLQNTRLSLVHRMANEIVDSLMQVIQNKTVLEAM